MKKLLAVVLLALAAGCVSTDNIRQYKPMKMEGMFTADVTVTVESEGETASSSYTNIFIPVSQIDPSMQFWGLTALPLSNEILVDYRAQNPTFFSVLWMDTRYDGEFTTAEGSVVVDTNFILIDPKTGERKVFAGPIGTYDVSNMQPFDVMEDPLVVPNDAFTSNGVRTLPEIVRIEHAKPDILKVLVDDLSVGPVTFDGVSYFDLESAIAAAEEVN